MADQFFELYRANGTGNTTKDWAIKVTGSDELTVYFGTTGSALRTRVIKCNGADPKVEKSKRISEKTAEGYQAMGQFSLDKKGRAVSINDIEGQVWALKEINTDLLSGHLSEMADDIADYPYSEILLVAEYDSNLKGIIFHCDGYLPEGGWGIAESMGLNHHTNGNSSGGGTIEFPLQIVLLAALRQRLGGDLLTAVATKGQQDKDLMPQAKGIPPEFIESLALSEPIIREVAMAVGMIAKPVPILSEGAGNTFSAICF